MRPLEETLRGLRKAPRAAQVQLKTAGEAPGVNLDSIAQMDTALLDMSEAMDDAMEAYTHLTKTPAR